jgi:hypothetical protein
MSYKLFDHVKVLRAYHDESVPVGATGHVIGIHGGATALTVEFVDMDGHIYGIVTDKASFFSQIVEAVEVVYASSAPRHEGAFLVSSSTIRAEISQ